MSSQALAPLQRPPSPREVSPSPALIRVACLRRRPRRAHWPGRAGDGAPPAGLGVVSTLSGVTPVGRWPQGGKGGRSGVGMVRVTKVKLDPSPTRGGAGGLWPCGHRGLQDPCSLAGRLDPPSPRSPVPVWDPEGCCPGHGPACFSPEGTRTPSHGRGDAACQPARPGKPGQGERPGSREDRVRFLTLWHTEPRTGLPLPG